MQAKEELKEEVKEDAKNDISYKLQPNSSFPAVKGPVVCIVLDGFGIGKEDDGDCVHLAATKNLSDVFKAAKSGGRYCSLKAHGTAVGLPDDSSMGNSEVGHNAMGCGQVIAQGAKLVNECMEDGSMFKAPNWKNVVAKNLEQGQTIHLMGLLSDGGIHSNISQVEGMVLAFANDGVTKLRLHILTDGRDVGSMSALQYIDRMEAALAATGRDYKMATGGGRMYVTMDRYESDWAIVQRGYDAMVHGVVKNDEGVGYKGRFSSCREAVEEVRKLFPDKTDQNYPPWVIVDDNDEAVGKIKDGDVVINFNFRGDRALQISQALGKEEFSSFPRGEHPKIDYYGMLIYDNDKGIPKKSLAPNPDIRHVLSQYLLASGVSQYAVSETHKFGHVTFFWNGNRSGYVDEKQELYEEVESEPNDCIETNPGMKADEITEKLLAALDSGKWKFLRVNYANGDMVGHTGLIPQTIASIQIMDTCVKQVVEKVQSLKGAVVITADHGNCEEMKDAKGKPKTSHSCNAVPFAIIDDLACYVVDKEAAKEEATDEPSLSNLAATLCNLLGFEAPSLYRKSLVKAK